MLENQTNCKECLQRLKATTQLLSNVCKRYNISATVIDKDNNEAPVADIILDNMAYIKKATEQEKTNARVNQQRNPMG